MFLGAHTSMNTKQHLNQFSHFCTAHLSAQHARTDHRKCNICCNRRHLRDACDTYNDNNHRSTAIIQVNLRKPAPPVKNYRILLVQSFTALTPLLTATSAFGLWRRRWSSHQQCYLHCLYFSLTHLMQRKNNSDDKKKHCDAV